MPLDGHSYLVAQGWSGKGNGLRKGAISKPITVSQKKTLAGLGKDRDEAFPFWDHLFSAASKAITVKIDDSDASDSDEPTQNVAPVLHRTTTGILSNRRPATITPASTSGSSTPELNSGPRLSLLAMAKREAAKRNLYSKFYRGAVLAPNVEPINTPDVAPIPSTSLSTKERKKKRKAEALDEDIEEAETKAQAKKEGKKKRKAEVLDEDIEEAETKAQRRERKRRKKEAKEMKAKEKLEKKLRKEAKRAAAASQASLSLSKAGDEDKEERRRRKREEKKQRPS
ncbi:hypothetical protein BT96DRAFT_1023327 [Gymnopus androsaceus JB14]|uniref:G-patch domain-containing protein n=1 Tax=Gymnopus androsaceus JB14 TaxID=1447944 RepID=A0A6A4H6Q4_9AGAR|nr:hypothetical protein BT96DRAFT_1023327 [Gymnopus androsaceus JB14]